MLTDNDKAMMKMDIAGIIGDWSEKVQIWDMKSSGLVGVNALMDEFVTDNDNNYNKQLDVPAYQPGRYGTELQRTVYGDKYEGKIVLHIPESYVINDTSIIVRADGSKWRVKLDKYTLGMTTVILLELVG